MDDIEPACYLRFHRRRSGLTQKELGKIIGHLTKDQVSKNELAMALPSLLSAFGYEVAFGVPLAELYPGLYKAVQEAIEERLVELETRLQQSSAKGRQAHAIARVLEWLSERNNQNSSH